MLADLGVLILPSRNTGVWRLALEQAAAAAGWHCEVVPPGPPPAAFPGKPTIFVTESASVFATFPVERTLVVYWPSEEVVELLMAMDPEGVPSHAIGRASVYLSAAQDLVERGARPVSGHSPLSSVNPAFPSTPVAGLLDPQIDHIRALTPYDAWPSPRDTAMQWSVSVLRFPKGRAQEGGSADVVLAGPPRVLVHGPYIHLPAGTWKGTFRLRVETEGEPVKVLFEWGNVATHGGELLEFPKDGEYEVSMESEVVADLSVELRASLVRATMQGKMSFSDVEVERV